MDGSREIFVARPLDELRQHLAARSAEAAEEGLGQVRSPWSDSEVKVTETGFYEFEVCADAGRGPSGADRMP